MKTWIRDRALLLVLLALFLASWAGQLVSVWFDFVNEQAQLGASAAFWSSEFWWRFGSTTLQNWQSEWLQLAAQIALPAYLVFKGAAQSRDSSERMEALITVLAQKNGIDPQEVYADLPEKYRPRAPERKELEHVEKAA